MSSPIIWEDIRRKLSEYKIEFDKSYKCLNKTALPKRKTQIKHLQILVFTHNSITGLTRSVFESLSPNHKIEVTQLIKSIRTKLEVLFLRLGIPHIIPSDITKIIDIRFSETEEEFSDENENEDEIETENLNNKPLVITPLNKDNQNCESMTSTAETFVGNASKLLPEFDGKIENLQKFIDALDVLALIKGTHESVAIALIKSKLDSTSRNLVTTENTIEGIKSTLVSKIKGEPTKSVVAKLSNIKQGTRSAHEFVKEIEELTKKLEKSYICDGVPVEMAKTYATDTAIKTLTTNGKSEQAKVSMKGVIYTKLSDAVSKFLEISSEDVAKVNYVKQLPQQRYNNYQKGRGNRSYNNRGRNTGRNYGNQRQNGGGNNHGNQNSGNNNNQSQRSRNRNVRYLDTQSENMQDPQDAQLGTL